MSRFAIIVAAGIGQRFGTKIPKQFLLLQGKPLLMHSIERFSGFTKKTVVVLPSFYLDHWQTLCNQYAFHIQHQVTTGGQTRTASVQSGLNLIQEEGWVAVHDAARPLVSANLITRTFAAAMKSGNAVPCIPLRDAIRQLTEKGNTSINRNDYRLIQTPQCFPVSELKEAFRQFPDQDFDDEASLMEKAGIPVNLIDGEETNLKITFESDLKLAEIFFNLNTV
jgi:2-C-methyl-D-erythritol 4-phosphate cytidylyltransferase